MAEASIILWGIKTTIFSLEYQFHRGKNVVLIVAGLVLRQRNGTQVTKLYITMRMKKHGHCFSPHVLCCRQGVPVINRGNNFRLQPKMRARDASFIKGGWCGWRIHMRCPFWNTYTNSWNSERRSALQKSECVSHRNTMGASEGMTYDCLQTYCPNAMHISHCLYARLLTSTICMWVSVQVHGHTYEGPHARASGIHSLQCLHRHTNYYRRKRLLRAMWPRRLNNYTEVGGKLHF